MKRSLRDAWIAALRSGDYKKTTGYFIVGPNSRINPSTDAEAFCCLGVLCAVAGVPIEDFDNGGNWSFVGETVGQPSVSELWRMNDLDCGDRYSFDDIADYIEASVLVDDEEEAPQ